MKNQTFGGYIRQLREQAKLSLKDVSEKCGWESVVYLSDIERGKRNPPKEEAIKILADLFNVDFSELSDLAIKSQEKIILPISNHHGLRAEAGLQLARAWDDMTDEDMIGLTEYLKSRKRI